tara:strand:- start:184 stop:1296 length:1113 start_codon:yes stop_codon:yes gene_type:complete
MDSTNKNKIKDYLILSLIDAISDLYNYNNNEDSLTIKNKFIEELKRKNILDVDINDVNIPDVKKQILKLISNEFVPLQNEGNQLSIYNNYKSYELIGNGAFSNVYKIYNTLDDNFYALKKIGIKDNIKEILFEVRSMAKLNHKNIVRYHTSWIETTDFSNKMNLLDSQLQLVKYEDSFDSSNIEDYIESNYNKFILIQMELCESNLKYYLENNELNLLDKVNICIDICNGLSYIHENDVIHRDLKLQNIFYSSDNIFKIGDFGLATKAYDLNYEIVGTYGYIAPEVLNGESYGIQADLYSLGMIFLDIFYNFETEMEKQIKLKDIKLKKPLNNIDKLITSLLENNPMKRLELGYVYDNLNIILEDCNKIK